MSTLGVLFTWFMLVVCIGVVSYVVYCYLTAPRVIVAKSTLDPTDEPEVRKSNFLDKLVYSTKSSSTLFVQLAVAFLTTLFNGILNMSDFFGAPEVRQWVTDNTTPGVSSTLLVLFVAVTVMARLRKE